LTSLAFVYSIQKLLDKLRPLGWWLYDCN